MLGKTVNAYGPFYIQHFYHSAIYLEAIRDSFAVQLADPNRRAFYQERYRREVDGTVAHEIGHSPPKIDAIEHHAEEGLMREGAGHIDELTFMPHTIKRFRSTKSWSSHDTL